MKRSMAVALALAALLFSPAARADSPKERAQKLMKTLATHKDPQERASAAESLGDMGAWDAVPALAAALKDPSADVRIAATYALTKLKDHAREAVPALKEMLSDPNGLVRYNAVVALQNLDAATPDELMPALGPLLADADKEIRENVLKMLFNVGLADKAVRDTLVGALELGPVEVRRQVADSLGHADIDLSDGPWVRELATRLMGLAAKDDDAKARREYVYVLRGLRPLPADVAQFLTRTMDDPDAEVASAAVAGLNSAEEDRTLARKAVTHLVTKLKTAPSTADKVRAALLLKDLPGYRELAVPGLGQALATDKDVAVRVQAARTLADFRIEEGITPLLQALKADTEAKVRVAAADALSSYRRDTLERAGQRAAVVAALRAALSDASPSVQEFAQTGIEKFQD